jgi:benzoyl-CoA reductase/2-hydroxyglutaryl-CoA dehydratase subunit BcrC/BadD/HgdB
MENAATFEGESELAALRGRADYSPAFDHFLEILRLGAKPAEFKAKFKKPLAGLSCVQVPLELVDAAGFHPFRLRCGSLAAQSAATGRLPFLACPAMKSCVGHFLAQGSLESLCDAIIVPSACDARFHVMDVPHSRESERSRERWFEELADLKRALERRSGERISAKALRDSIAKYADAWSAFGKLAELRRRRKLSGVWFIAIANAFLIDDAEEWTQSAEAAVEAFEGSAPEPGPSVMLSGSPVFFPNLKIARLIEQAGMALAADELCSSERVLAGLPVCDDLSLDGQLRALSERYLLGCHCPTFSDNDRRAPNIVAEMKRHGMKGLVYHLLKGCHPYDIESRKVERAVKAQGLHFIKLETDYSKEDQGSMLVRLEAFRETL